MFAKLASASKMATDRLLDDWEVPACCFGSVAGKGLAATLHIHWEACSAKWHGLCASEFVPNF